MKNLDARLRAVEKAVMPDCKRFAVVTYAVGTWPPAVIPAAPGVVYLPHNGRDRVWGVKSLAPGKVETGGQRRAHIREIG